MPRQPNYRFERHQRDKAKAAKKAAKQAERAARRDSRRDGDDPDLEGIVPGPQESVPEDGEG
jgi:hypothetical protein